MNKTDITKDIIFAADSSWDVFLRTHVIELDGRKGGVLAIIPLPENDSLTVEALLDTMREISFGVLSDEKKTEKSGFARKKIEFLLRQYYMTAKGHFANYSGPLCTLEAEDEANGLYGGGIITDTHIIAFSGFPPDIDQKFVILAAEAANDISKARVIDIWYRSAANEKKCVDKRAA